MNTKTKKMVGIGLFCAMVLVLQYVFGNITVGGTSINPVLVPVVLGAALYGWQAGALLGLVSGIAILTITPPQLFLGWNVAGTIITVLVKGTAAGLVSSLVYHLISKYSRLWAVVAAAALCPVVNTGLFVAGCYLFFLPGIATLTQGDAFTFIMTVFVGVNFFVELGINLILASTIARLIKIGLK